MNDLLYNKSHLFSSLLKRLSWFLLYNPNQPYSLMSLSNTTFFFLSLFLFHVFWRCFSLRSKGVRLKEKGEREGSERGLGRAQRHYPQRRREILAVGQRIQGFRRRRKEGRKEEASGDKNPTSQGVKSSYRRTLEAKNEKKRVRGNGEGVKYRWSHKGRNETPWKINWKGNKHVPGNCNRIVGRKKKTERDTSQ